MIIGVKVGSSLPVSSDGNMDKRFIRSLIMQLADLINCGHQPYLVSSGAVASDFHKGRSNELRAAVGQPKLLAAYLNELSNHCQPPRDGCQLLLLKDDLFDRGNRNHLKRVIEEAFADCVLPIINANDPLNSEELDRLAECEDNDELFGHLCRLMRPDLAIFVTDVDGVKDGSGSVIHVLDANGYVLEPLESESAEMKTIPSKGGMASKVKVAQSLLRQNAARGCVIVNGRCPDFIGRAIEQFEQSNTGFGTVVEI